MLPVQFAIFVLAASHLPELAHSTSPSIDTVINSHHIIRKRYVLRRKQWSRNNLTWKLKKQMITAPDEYIIRNTLHRAFNIWETASSVKFREVANSDKADIEIAFEKGTHNDSFAFDGPDGIVAHAFYPVDGRLHFDADEKWTLNSNNGINLYQTAVHEIGHLLGLEHSSDPRAHPYNPEFELADDDIRAIRLLFPLKRSSIVKGAIAEQQQNFAGMYKRYINMKKIYNGSKLKTLQKSVQVNNKNKHVVTHGRQRQLSTNRVKQIPFEINPSLWPSFLFGAKVNRVLKCNVCRSSTNG